MIVQRRQVSDLEDMVLWVRLALNNIDVCDNIRELKSTVDLERIWSKICNNMIKA